MDSSSGTTPSSANGRSIWIDDGTGKLRATLAPDTAIPDKGSYVMLIGPMKSNEEPSVDVHMIKTIGEKDSDRVALWDLEVLSCTTEMKKAMDLTI
eukprot:CAMPEP_0184527508 /NCGR_PEP_ID=MMETSP0198_2-20121128/11253_1 /TAXON_ID=1112570 /ORGANISM="Thraustochytrium sp., Strain LLF1b" /LENGTH=95 /DNA_ID=CAMNT_0026919207 /DNA_START=814 /DNA_END=1101 /DNA_ORIENTATION=+